MFGLQKKSTPEAEEQTTAVLTPAVDITETEAGYTIIADVPGMDKENVDVSFENGVVTLKASRESNTEVKVGETIHREFKHASYERAFRVGDDIDSEKISAEITNGVLRVTLPRKASSTKRTIAVNAK
ncbi:MAG: hypothetical protein LDLANPLL_01355 [Turneriella sp.]|nr:hypothetical protein [Turneriella sp.]